MSIAVNAIFFQCFVYDMVNSHLPPFANCDNYYTTRDYIIMINALIAAYNDWTNHGPATESKLQ